MTSKIDIVKIFKAHFKTLRNVGCDGVSWNDVISFYVVPALCSGWLVFAEKKVLDESGANFLATVFSIFVGLLLNLLVLIIGIMPRSELQGGVNAMDPVRVEVLKETFANISYAILISTLLIILLFASKLARGVVLSGCSFVAFVIVGNFILTILMVLKRVHTILMPVK